MSEQPTPYERWMATKRAPSKTPPMTGGGVILHVDKAPCHGWRCRECGAQYPTIGAGDPDDPWRVWLRCGHPEAVAWSDTYESAWRRAQHAQRQRDVDFEDELASERWIALNSTEGVMTDGWSRPLPAGVLAEMVLFMRRWPGAITVGAEVPDPFADPSIGKHTGLLKTAQMARDVRKGR